MFQPYGYQGSLEMLPTLFKYPFSPKIIKWPEFSEWLEWPKRPEWPKWPEWPERPE